jgi:hypothetical protein
MPLNEKDLGLIAVGVAIVGVLVYIAYDQTDRTGQPRYQNTPVTASLSVMDTAIDALDTGDHYFHPAFCAPGQTQIFIPHKYPAVSGGNISTLIHQGMDALRRDAPQDDDWLKRPPGEVMWL